MNHYLQGTVTAVFSLALVACGGGGGGGTCGEVANGGVCAENADCACGLTCISEACASSFGKPGVDPEAEPEKTYPHTAEMKSFCGVLAGLPCVPEERKKDIEGCYDNFSESHGKAKEVGCNSQFLSAVDCIKQNIECPEGSAVDDSLSAVLDTVCASKGFDVEACIDSQEDECGEIEYNCASEIPLEGMEPSFECTVGVGDDCGQAGSECSLVDGSDPPQYKCTCTNGKREGDIFYGYASDCCNVNLFVEKACGFVPVE
jgi:hypothetical protein